MKRIIVIALMMFILLFSGIAFADSINSIIPDDSKWGISQEDFKTASEAECTRFFLGKTPGLIISGVDIDSYAMDCYYLFGAPMQTSSGKSYWGLSKLTCLWSGTEKRTSDELRQCYGTLVDDMKATIGEPVSADKAKTTWKDSEYIVEIGNGRFAKYTGSDNYTIAIIVTWANIPKPTEAPQKAEDTDNGKGYSELVEFKSKMMKSVSSQVNSAADFTTSAKKRAILAALLSLEFLNQRPDFTYDYNLPIFVCKQGNIASVAMGGKNEYVVIMYQSKPLYTAYGFLYGNDPATVKASALLSSESVWQVDIHDYNEMLSDLIDQL